MNTLRNSFKRFLAAVAAGTTLLAPLSVRPAMASGNAVGRVPDSFSYTTEWKVTKYASQEAYERGEAYESNDIHGNVLLNAGITLLLNLLIGAGGTDYGNANAYIGVGDDNTAASASQTALQAASNKTWKAMETSYPAVSGQTVTFRSVFASGDANYAWKEFTVVNASSDSGTNLNRKVSDQGTKVSGQVWTVDVAITFS